MKNITFLTVMMCICSVAFALNDKVKPKITINVSMGVPKGGSRVNMVYSAKVIVVHNSSTTQEISFASTPQYNGKTVFKMNSALPSDVEITEFSEFQYSIEPQNSGLTSSMVQRIRLELDKNKKEPGADALNAFKSILGSSGSNPFQVLQSFIQKYTN